MVKNFDDMCNRLGTIPACDRQTDGHLATAYTRYAYASHSKNYIFNKNSLLTAKIDCHHPFSENYPPATPVSVG